MIQNAQNRVAPSDELLVGLMKGIVPRVKHGAWTSV